MVLDGVLGELIYKYICLCAVAKHDIFLVVNLKKMASLKSIFPAYVCMFGR